MSMQDPIADLLTCIRNAQSVGITIVQLPYSRLKHDIVAILKDEGYIANYEVLAIDKKKNLQISLKYYHGQPVIDRIDRISRPALRIYRGYAKLPIIRGGLGVAIVSTPRGVMSDKAARAQKLGGEVLCTVE